MSTEVAEKPRARRDYTTAEIHRALVEVAACSGNTHAAARNLAKDDGAPPVPQKTLWEWANRRHTQDYERIRQEALPAITAQAADQHMALARQQMELAQAAAGFVAARLDKMDDRDLVNAMGKADIGSGIHTEKAQLLGGQPTQIVQRDASEVLRKLKSRGIVIDGQVLSEEDVSAVDEGSASTSSEAVVESEDRSAVAAQCSRSLA